MLSDPAEHLHWMSQICLCLGFKMKEHEIRASSKDEAVPPTKEYFLQILLISI